MSYAKIQKKFQTKNAIDDWDDDLVRLRPNEFVGNHQHRQRQAIGQFKIKYGIAPAIQGLKDHIVFATRVSPEALQRDCLAPTTDSHQ